MREIKFRGKRIDNGEWVYGSLVVQETTRIFSWGLAGWESNEVIPETVGQYIGLKDKSRKEIYSKSDIIQFRDHRDTIELGWSKNNEYSFIWTTSKNIITKQDEINKRYKIIGNIFDNPEFLKDIDE